MDVVDADVRREPAQDARQVIIGTSMQRSFVKTPGLVMGPGGALELMLDIEQSDADRRCQNRDRQMHQQERPKANQANHHGDKNRDGSIRTHCTQPWLPTVTHHPDRQPMPQDEQICGTDAKHYDRVPVQTIKDLTPSRPREELAHGQRINVTEASAIEIS